MMTLLAAVLAIQAPGPEETQGPFRSTFRASTWLPDLKGRFSADEGIPLIEGTSFSLDNDLDLDDGTGVLRYEMGIIGKFGVGGHAVEIERFTMSYWGHQWEGESVLDHDEIFNERSYPAGTPVESRFRVGSIGVDTMVFASGAPGQNIDGGMTFGARYVDVKATVESATDDSSERTRLLYLGPGMRVEWKPQEHVIAMMSLAGYFSFGVIEDEVLFDFEEWAAMLVEANAALGFRSHHLDVVGGYRVFSNVFDIARDNDDASEENLFRYFLGGPFVEVTLKF